MKVNINDRIKVIDERKKRMYKIILTWAGTETEEKIFETKEEAEQFIKDAVGPYSNCHATMIEL